MTARRPELIPGVRAYWEEYNCGCVSRFAKERGELVGYCGKHGDDRRGSVHACTVTKEEYERGTL